MVISAEVDFVDVVGGEVAGVVCRPMPSGAPVAVCGAVGVDRVFATLSIRFAIYFCWCCCSLMSFVLTLVVWASGGWLGMGASRGGAYPEARLHVVPRSAWLKYFDETLSPWPLPGGAPTAAWWYVLQSPSGSRTCSLSCSTHRSKSPGVPHPMRAAPAPWTQNSFRRAAAPTSLGEFSMSVPLYGCAIR